MDRQLLRQLKNAGFERGLAAVMMSDFNEPSLEELIDACGENFGTLSQHVERKLWEATTKIEKDKPAVRGIGATPSEAVASLWLAWMNEVNKP